MPEFRPGDVFVDYRIEGLAGRGGMGVVYRATQITLERTVALKVIAPALADDEDFRRRFVAESKAGASVEHPNVIPVYYAGEREGVLFIVMRYIDGPDLRSLVRAEQRLEPERAAHIVAQVGSALDAAHRHGLVHRDVKPANVLLGEDDHAYLTDFGLTKHAATTAGAGGLSRAGGWVGTLGYVAPEQIRGERVDARTDVYALGCVLVYALTGKAPYSGDSDEATLWAHLNAPPPSESVPPDFEGVIARALAKDPSDRYLSAGDLGRAALRAAGRSATSVPERYVGRGLAAPATEDTADTALQGAAAPALADPDGETRLSPAAGRRPAVAEQRWSVPTGGRRTALAAGVVALLAVAAALALLGGGGDGDGDPAEPARTTTAPARLAASIADPPRTSLLTRPNSLTIAAGKVWAMSFKDGAVQLVDAATGKPGERLNLGPGLSSLSAGFGSVWVTKSDGRTRRVLRINAKTRKRVRNGSVEIARPGRNVAVATGAGAVWVAVRNLSDADHSPESIVRINPSSGRQQEIPMPDGVQDLAVGEGAVWVTNRFSDTVTKVRVSDLKRARVPVGAGPKGIAVGEGAVWVAASLDDEITRLNPRSLQVRHIKIDAIPERITVGGGSVWATAKEAGRLIRIDARSRKVLQRIDTSSRPFALDITRGRAVWLTLLDSGGVQRVRFFRPG